MGVTLPGRRPEAGAAMGAAMAAEAAASSISERAVEPRAIFLRWRGLAVASDLFISLRLPVRVYPRQPPQRDFDATHTHLECLIYSANDVYTICNNFARVALVLAAHNPVC